MKPVVWAIAFGVVFLLMGSGSANADQDQDQEWELIPFMEYPTAGGFQALELVYDRRIREMGLADLVALERSMEKSLFLDTIKVYFPYLLPPEFPGKTVYLSCFSELYDLIKNLTSPSHFAGYYDCMNYGSMGIFQRTT